jgi:hypothetical protein
MADIFPCSKRAKAPPGIRQWRSPEPDVSLSTLNYLQAAPVEIPTTGPVGEQSNAYRILLRYDRKSRHRRIKKQRRYERLAATSQLSLL